MHHEVIESIKSHLGESFPEVERTMRELVFYGCTQERFESILAVVGIDIYTADVWFRNITAEQQSHN